MLEFFFGEVSAPLWALTFGEVGLKFILALAAWEVGRLLWKRWLPGYHIAFRSIIFLVFGILFFVATLTAVIAVKEIYFSIKTPSVDVAKEKVHTELKIPPSTSEFLEGTEPLPKDILAAEVIDPKRIKKEPAFNDNLRRKEEHLEQGLFVNEIQSFEEGLKKTFRTKDHPKAKGLNLTIDYPVAWSAKEGERPNILQKFVSPSGFESVMIGTKKLPENYVLSESEKHEMFSSPEYKKIIPPQATLISAKGTMLEGSPAGIIEYTQSEERLGVITFSHVLQVNFVVAGTVVGVPCAATGVNKTENEVNARAAALKPLCLLIANSILFPDRYK